VAGLFWYEARLDRDYVALNQQFETAAAANAAALAQAEVVDAVESEEVAVETPVETTEAQPEATFEDLQAKKRELERERLERERLRKEQPSIQPSPSATEQAIPASSATVASLRTETRERRAAPPMTSQVPVNQGMQPVADNRSSGMLPSGSAGAPPPPPAAAPAGKVVVAAEATSRFQPTFPKAASMAGISGSVGVMVTINEQGNVVEARAMSGPPLLKDAAVSAARKWKFRPSTIGGSPVKTTKTIVFNFKADR
jgi:TonB family protein